VAKSGNSGTYDGLLEQYLEICNKVMQQNRDRFPYSQIWQAGEQALSGRAVELAVVDDAPKAHKCVTLEACKINSEPTGKAAEDPPVMRLSASYLEDVVAHPDKYIDNPSLIDWDWLTIRK